MKTDAFNGELALYRALILVDIAIIVSLVGWVYTADVSNQKLILPTIVIIGSIFILIELFKTTFSLISEMKNADAN